MCSMEMYELQEQFPVLGHELLTEGGIWLLADKQVAFPLVDASS